MLIGIIGWIVLGLIAGAIANKFVDLRNDDPRLGVAVGGAGAVVGGWLYSAISGSAVSGFNVWSLVFACIASVAALVTYHVVRRRAVPPVKRSW